MARDKTKTIVKRSVSVYAPTLETVERWKEASNKAGMSLSKFIIECIEDAIREDENYQPRADLLNDVEELRSENAELKKRIKMLDALVEKQEREIKRFMSKSFTEKKEGVRRYDKELVDLIRRKKQVNFDDIVFHLNLDRKDPEVMRAVNRQLEHLEDYGLIIPFREGYKWNE